MMKRFLIVLYVLLLLWAWPAQAQDEPRISNLEISLWPEFDRPEALVIYRGVLASDISLPVSVEIRIPARVGQPSAVAYVDNGQQLNQQHITRVEGDWLVVSFELNTAGFQLEYYDTLPVDTEDRREYTFDYVADYAVDALNLEFQVPPTAQDFTLEPPADSVVVEGDGLTYHLVEATAFEQGEEKSWALSYVKPDTNLTLSGSVQPEAPVQAEPAATGSSDNSTALIFLLAFVIVVAVGAGAFWLGRRTEIGAEPVPSTSRRHKRRGSGRGSPSQSGGGKALFCHQCGADLRPDSDFCHKCGTAVRER